MKHIKPIGLAVLLLAESALAGKLVLNEKFGLTEKVEVRSYDGRTQAVRIREDTEIKDRDLNSFPDAAQEEILAWAADEIFKSSFNLRIKTKKKEIKGERGESVQYEIFIKNRSYIFLPGLQIESWIFYEFHEGQETFFYELHRGETFLKRYLKSDVQRDVGPRELVRVQTPMLEMRDYKVKIDTYDRLEDESGQYLGGDDGYRVIQVRDELEGMLVVIKKKGRDGKVLTRDVKNGRIPSASKRKKYRPPRRY